MVPVPDGDERNEERNVVIRSLSLSLPITVAEVSWSLHLAVDGFYYH